MNKLAQTPKSRARIYSYINKQSLLAYSKEQIANRKKASILDYLKCDIGIIPA